MTETETTVPEEKLPLKLVIRDDVEKILQYMHKEVKEGERVLVAAHVSHMVNMIWGGDEEPDYDEMGRPVMTASPSRDNA